MTDDQQAEYLCAACLGALATLAHPARASPDIATARSLLAAALLITTQTVTAEHEAVIRSILTDDERQRVA